MCSSRTASARFHNVVMPGFDEMSIDMVRIDDRLIHGQVVAGWCPVINPDSLILCDDDVAASEWESQLYKDAAFEYETLVFSVNQTVELLHGKSLESKKVFVVVNSPKTVVRLLDGGLPIARVVVGGMHFQPGKREIADFIFIDDDDLSQFRILRNRGVTIEAKNVPTCKAIDILSLLGLK